MAQSDTRTRIKPSEAVKEPPMFKVIYLNDNQTTMEFIVESLIEYFDYTAETAEQITIDIHQAGQATVAVLPFELFDNLFRDRIHHDDRLLTCAYGTVIKCF